MPSLPRIISKSNNSAFYFTNGQTKPTQNLLKITFCYLPPFQTYKIQCIRYKPPEAKTHKGNKNMFIRFIGIFYPIAAKTHKGNKDATVHAFEWGMWRILPK